MKTKIYFAELQTTLFLAGKNHGVKLSSKSGLHLEYDEEKRHLFITFNGQEARIPEPNIASMTTPDPDAKFVRKAAPAPVNKVRAQVSTPQDHVFADGPGKTRD